MKKLAFLDLETTGLFPDQHEILEVGIVYEDGSEVGFKVKPEHIETASPEALKINGYNEEDWKDAISQEEAATRLSELLDGFIIAGQNVRFDTGFTDALAKRFGVKIESRYVIDTVTLAYAILVPLGIQSLSLKAICKFLRIPSEPDIHRALNGARTAREVYFRLANAGILRRFWWGVRANTPETNRHRTIARCLTLLGVLGFAQFLQPSLPIAAGSFAHFVYLGLFFYGTIETLNSLLPYVKPQR